MPSYEVCYFNARGRAEVARLCFAYAGIPFKDSRYTDEEWPAQKRNTKKFPYGQVPVLLIDGKSLSESHAINRYVAKVTGLDGGPNPVAVAYVDEAYEVFRSFVDSVHNFYMVKLGYITGDKDKLYKEVFVPNVQKFFPKIISLLRPNGFLSDNGVTFADFYVSGYIESYLQHGFAEVNKFPALIKHLTDVKSLPQLQDYLHRRPHTSS